jgi:DNA-binding transcriptional regulator LsrR (DeoR family)
LLALAAWHKVTVDYLLGGASPTPPAVSARGVKWRLAWSRPSAERELGAAIWERLVRGEPPAQISHDLDINDAGLERYVQDLVLSESVIVEKVERNTALEREVQQRFTDETGRARLRDVWVADLEHIARPSVRYVLLGHLAKDHFREQVDDGNSVGLCGGFAVSRMVHALKRGECPGGIRVFPIAVTPVFESAAVSANGVVSALGYRHYGYGVQVSELPFLFEEVTGQQADDESGRRAEERNGQRRSPPLRIAERVRDDASRVDFVFMGIGSPERGALTEDISALQRDYQWLARVDVEDLRRQGPPVGDILYHLVDADGEPIRGFKEQNERLVCSIGLEGLRQLVDHGKRVVVIASGREKAAVTQAAISGGYVNVLIIDDGLARGLTRPRRG